MYSDLSNDWYVSFIIIFFLITRQSIFVISISKSIYQLKNKIFLNNIYFVLL